MKESRMGRASNVHGR